jgi:hypothetical protein
MDSSEPGASFAMDNTTQQQTPSTGMTTPIVTLNAPTTTTATAPIVDTTVSFVDTTAIPAVRSTVGSFPSFDTRKQPITRIEGMEALKIQMLEDERETSNLTESEKRMKEEELSFYSASENDFGDDNIWGLLSGVGGNIYEWYVSSINNRRTMPV